MCGIIAAFNRGKNPTAANQSVIDQFQDQKNRGQNGFGAILINPNGQFKIKRATEPVKILLDLYQTPSPMIIFHHRQPTSSDNKLQQTHPILISHGSLKYDYYLVHNGIITNHHERRTTVEKDLGFTLSTLHKKMVNTWETEEYNDSELLGIDLARYLEKQDKKIHCQGYAAFIMAQVNKKTQLIEHIHCGRTIGGALNLDKNKNSLFFSSEGPGKTIDEETIYSFNLKDWRFEKRTFKLAETPPVKTLPVTTYYNGYQKDNYTGYEGFDQLGHYSHYPPKPKIQTSIGFKTKEERKLEDKTNELLAEELEQKIKSLKTTEYNDLITSFSAEAEDRIDEANEQIAELTDAYFLKLKSIWQLKSLDDKKERNQLLSQIAKVIIDITKECYNLMLLMVDETLNPGTTQYTDTISAISEEGVARLHQLPEKLASK